MCWIFMVMVIFFLWNWRRMLIKLFNMLGFWRSIEFNDIFWYFVDELNIICMFLGFLGWNIVNIGKYYFLILIGSFGVNLVCLFWRSFFIKLIICFCFMVFECKLVLNDLVLCKVMDWLFGRGCLLFWKGNGVF